MRLVTNYIDEETIIYSYHSSIMNFEGEKKLRTSYTDDETLIASYQNTIWKEKKSENVSIFVMCT